MSFSPVSSENHSAIPEIAVILAGGKGTRLGDLAKNLPKPMIDIAGKPLLERQVEWLKEFGIKKVILLTGYMAQQIRDYFGNGSRWGIAVEIIEEKEPLGTAGALKQLKGKIHEPFWVVYGDLVASLSLDKVAEFHAKTKAFATLVVHPNDHPYDSDLVDVDENSQILKFITKPHPPGLIARNLVNAAVYILPSEIFDMVPDGFRGDLARDIFPDMVIRKKVMAFNSPEYLKDMGTPDRLKKVRDDWESGKVQRLRISYPRPTVFLDRDGVVLQYVPDIHKSEDVKLREGSAEAIRKLNRAGYLVIVVTNQPMIAKGFLNEKDLHFIHAKMETMLGDTGAWVERIYYCPHHPEKGFPGERVELKIDCDCRKPKTGMLEAAGRDFNIDRPNSWMVGDTWRDAECGQKFQIRTLGVAGGEGYPYKDAKSVDPEKICADLLAAVDYILAEGILPRKEMHT